MDTDLRTAAEAVLRTWRMTQSVRPDQMRAMGNALAAPALPEPAVIEWERIAWLLAEQDGHDDPGHLIWEGSPPEPWGEVWCRYETQARAIAALFVTPEPAVKAGWRLVSEAWLRALKDDVNTLAALHIKSERFAHGTIVKLKIADLLAAAPEIAQAPATEKDHRESVPSGTDPASLNALGDSAQEAAAVADARDAARYRWLRAASGRAPAFAVMNQTALREPHEWTAAELDAAIDAALSHQQADPTADQGSRG